MHMPARLLKCFEVLNERTAIRVGADRRPEIVADIGASRTAGVEPVGVVTEPFEAFREPVSRIRATEVARSVAVTNAG
jgi:hypothetical protein